jgi:SAM-dependent methyltransferase
MKRDLHEENRLAWNAATVAHNSHKGDQAAFFRGGGSTLFPEERELLGDVAGLRVVHLQCNAGQDTLSIARLGAEVTGVDISDEAIDFARRLSGESGIAARFERADVFDWLAEAVRGEARWDVVFVSYGALTWLSDLGAWARGIAGILAAGGRLVLVEFHPVLGMFDEELRLTWPYSSAGKETGFAEGIGDYVAQAGDGLVLTEYHEGVKDFKNPHRSWEFQWGIADVLQPLIGAGLRIETFREYPYSNGAVPYHGMRTGEGGRRYLPDGVPSFPLMYGVAARKAG